MKIILAEMSPWAFRSVVVPTAGILLLIMARVSGARMLVDKNMWGVLALSALFNITGWHVFSAYGLTILGAGEAALIAYTMPLWTSVLSVFVLGEKMSVNRIAALVLGLSGVALLVDFDMNALGAAPLGVFFMLMAATSWGTGVVLIKRFTWGVPTVTLAGWQLVFGSIPILIIAFAFDPNLFNPVSTNVWFALGFVIVGPLCFCVYGFLKIVSLFPASVSAIGTLMIPVVGVVSGALILDEPIGLRQVGAMVMISIALALALFRK